MQTTQLATYYMGGGIGPADPASAGPKYQNYNPQSLFMSAERIYIGTTEAVISFCLYCL